MSHSHDPPLAPKIRVQKPPWWPSYEEYHGRPDWWTEHGYQDILKRKGVNTGMRQTLREKDKYWWDPKVPDGTSVIGPFGLDSQWHKNTRIKADQPGNFYEFQQKVMKSTAQYKNMISKFELSKEHPGIAVNVTLDKMNNVDYRNIGGLAMGRIRYHMGPRFWDKPLNEGCIEKGLGLAKLMAIYTFGQTCLTRLTFRKEAKYRDTRELIDIKGILIEWSTKKFPLPGLLSFIFGVSACTAAKARNKDDAWNWTIASVLTGAMYMTLNDFSMAKGANLAFPMVMLGLFFQYGRVHWHGLQGLTPQRMFSGEIVPFTGPLNWKYIPLMDISQTQLGHVQDRTQGVA